MRKHIILFFSALVFLTACKQNKTPDGILPEDVMARLLADIHITDGSLMNEVGPDSLFKNGTGRYMLLFKLYHTDSGTFKRSLRYYSRDNTTMMSIYDGVGKIVTKKTDSVNAIQNAIAQKELERLQKKQKEDLEKGKKEQNKREADQQELIRQENERRMQQEAANPAVEQERARQIERAKAKAMIQRDSINRALKLRMNNTNKKRRY